MSAKRALIVDDSRSARIFLTRILQRYDLQVDGAASAEEAIEYLTSEHPDVIFMDHLMPGMDGFQALSAIKNDPRTAAIPVMMYTSQEGELYVDQARALGAVGVLPKQTRPDDVNRALQQLRLLGEPKPVELVRADVAPVPALAPATPTAAAAAPPAVAAASFAGSATPLTGMTPELRAQLDALLRDHGIELRRFVAASLAQHTGQIISEVRALMDGTAAPPAAAAEPTPALPAAAVPAPQAAVARPLHGGSAALWLSAAAALIALAAGVFWYRASLLDAWFAAHPGVATKGAPSAAPANAVAPPVAQVVPALAPAQTLLVESVPFGEPPFAGARVDLLRSLLDQLSAAGFRGVVEIRSYPGRFCMQAGGAAPQLPAADVGYAKCGSVGNPLDYADARSLQSAEFAGLLAAQAGRGRGALDVQLIAGGADEVATPYPAISGPLTAGEWNRAAAANNRIEVRTRSLH
jgi:CheY-like chemotaxis protein